MREALDGDLGRDLRGLLSRAEIRATVRRVDVLLETGRFPLPVPGLAGDPLAAVLGGAAGGRQPPAVHRSGD